MTARSSIVAVCLLAGACSSSPAVATGKAIRDSLTAARTRGTLEVRAEQIAPGAWTDLFVFEPYTPPRVIARCVDAAVDHRGIADRDDIALLVFRFADGRAVSRAVPRGEPDFAKEVAPARYARNATFRIVVRDSGLGAYLTPSAGRVAACAWTAH